MRLIAKKTQEDYPQIYKRWLNENEFEISRLATSQRNPRHLWALFGKTLGEEQLTTVDPDEFHYEFKNALYEEQYGLCCYCGGRLKRDWDESNNKWAYDKTQSIEHFLPKNQNLHLIFNYKNLLLCCKGSSSYTKYRVGDNFFGVKINGFEEVSVISELSIEKIQSYRPNQHLQRRGIQTGDVIHIPNPLHCDDEKSKHDSKPNITIINPTEDSDLMSKLTFNADGDIDSTGATTDEQEIINKTITVLGLRVEKLVEKRKSVWEKARPKYDETFTEVGLNNIPADRIRVIVKGLIDSASIPDDSDGLLSPFYFVEVDYLKSLFGPIQ